MMRDMFDNAEVQSLSFTGGKKMSNRENEVLDRILASLDRISLIQPTDIPNIDLYMDQVTTFMDSKMHSFSRGTQDERILTKTMINNYAKNDLIPPPVKKKYSKEHVLLLIFIYYYKSILSINDIQTLLEPITDKYFHKQEGFRLQDIYSEVRELEYSQIESLKEDVRRKYQRSKDSFGNAPEEDTEFLQQFGFICMLSFDVYMKKVMIERLLDDMIKRELVKTPEKEQQEKQTKDKQVKEKQKEKKTDK